MSVLRRRDSGQGALRLRGRGRNAGAWIAKEGVGLNGSKELQNIWRPDCALLAGAKPQSADGSQIKRQLVGIAREFASRVSVPRFAKSALEGQPLHQLVGDQRNPRLAENLFRVDRTANGKTCSPKPAMSPVCGEFIRIKLDSIFPKFCADVDCGAFVGPGAANSPAVELDGGIHVANLLPERPAHGWRDGKIGGGLRGHLSGREHVPRHAVRIRAWRGRTKLARDQHRAANGLARRRVGNHIQRSAKARDRKVVAILPIETDAAE